MKNVIINIALTLLVGSSLASEPWITDHKYNISFPDTIGDLTFGYLSISEQRGHEVEVQYSGDLGSCELLFNLIPNDRTYSIYDGKARVGYTKPVSELSNREVFNNEWGNFYDITTLLDWQEYNGVGYYAYSYTNWFSVDVRSNSKPSSGGLKEGSPRFKFTSVFRFQNFTLIAVRRFSSEDALIRSNHKQTIDQVRKTFSNQQVDPIVTTPVDEVEAQSTQGHP